MAALKCSGTKTIQSRISAQFSWKSYEIHIEEKRKYTNKSEQIFETTGTSNSWIILESRNSESFSLSGPHILGHLCYQNKVFRNF